MGVKVFLRNKVDDFVVRLENKRQKFRSALRRYECMLSCRIHGSTSKGGPKTVQLRADRLIEACYLPDTSDLCIEVSLNRFCAEPPMFCAGVALFECALCDETNSIGSALCDSRYVREQLEHNLVTFDGQCPEPDALYRWLVEEYLEETRPFGLRICSMNRKVALSVRDARSRIQVLRACRFEVAQKWCEDMASTFKLQKAYVASVWKFDAKFSFAGHSSDVRQWIQNKVDKQLGICD